MTTRLERSEPGATTTNRSPSDPYGTWTIDPATSTVCFAWRALGLWTVTGRRQCLGVIHLDELPPAGVIRFEQPSNLPVLTMAPSPPTGPRGWSSCAWRPTPRRAAATGWCCGAGVCWTAGPSPPAIEMHCGPGVVAAVAIAMVLIRRRSSGRAPRLP
jgi:hypothetical protein